MLPIDFAIETIHFQPPRDGQPPISVPGTEHVPPKDNLAVQISLQEQTKIKLNVWDENCGDWGY